MEATKKIAELRAEINKISAEAKKTKENYKQRLKNVVSRLPKNYASIASFITTAEKKEIYNVRQGRKINEEILSVLEQIAEEYQKTIQKNSHNIKNEFVTNENIYKENCNVIADLQENLYNLQKDLHNPENFTNHNETQNPETQEKNNNTDTKETFVKKVSLSLYNNNIKNNLDIKKESKERKQNRETAKLFKEVFPDFQTFRNMLPDWDEFTAKHWYEQAEYWSSENNAKKKDWIKTVQIWNKRNPIKYINNSNQTNQTNQSNEIKIKETKNKIQRLENELNDLRILWKERPHQREYINQEAKSIQNEIKRLQKWLLLNTTTK